MVDTHKLAEMEKLLQKVQDHFREYGVRSYDGGTICGACHRRVGWDYSKEWLAAHEDTCIVKEVLSFDSSSAS